ncbi:MAG TPA: transposase [Candidatus Coprocola pullicola]|nr:transposase [Candidatus Coprocola pullicola]
MGSKGKYKQWLEEDKLLLLESWARDGCLDVDIAKKIGINTATLYTWKKKYSKFNDALKKGKEVVDTEVENALLKRALGYKYSEVKTESFSDGSVKKTVIVKEMPSDVTAQIYWLKNRKPENWRDKPSNEKEVAKIEVELIKNEEDRKDSD